jgi:hypothetical protein
MRNAPFLRVLIGIAWSNCYFALCIPVIIFSAAVEYEAGWMHVAPRGIAALLMGSTTGFHRYDPAIVRIRQTGPALWVGSRQAIEGGVLFLIVTAMMLAIALLYASRTGKMPPWKASLLE